MALQTPTIHAVVKSQTSPRDSMEKFELLVRALWYSGRPRPVLGDGV